MFPGAHAQVYYNEAGEPLGWDYPSYDDEGPSWADDDWANAQNYEAPEPQNVQECIEMKLHAKDGRGIDGWWVCDYCDTPYAEMGPDEILEVEENSI